MRTSVADVLRTGAVAGAVIVPAHTGASAVEQVLTGQAADPAVDPNCPAEEEEEIMDKKEATQTATLAAAAPVQPAAAAVVSAKTGRPAGVIIAEICQLAGHDADATRLIAAHDKGTITVQQIREHYLAERAATSKRTSTASHVHPSPTGGANALSELMGTIESQRANSNGELIVAQLERVLLSNDGIYESYLDHKDTMGMTRKGRRAYMNELIPQLAANHLGCGVMISQHASMHPGIQ